MPPVDFIFSRFSLDLTITIAVVFLAHTKTRVGSLYDFNLGGRSPQLGAEVTSMPKLLVPNNVRRSSMDPKNQH